MEKSIVKFGIVIPVANEGKIIEKFTRDILNQLEKIKANTSIYYIVDKASLDDTYEKLKKLSKKYSKIKTIYAPDNRNVVDAYLRGFKEALKDNCEAVIEMDCGYSHKPREIYKFVEGIKEGYDCVFGVRPLWSKDYRVPFKRRLFSILGTIFSNLFLGTRYTDATSGFEAFRGKVIREVISEPFLSTAHFYQTEMRYRCKKYRYKEVLIHYDSPSERVNWNSLVNSLKVLFYYFLKRL